MKCRYLLLLAVILSGCAESTYSPGPYNSGYNYPYGTYRRDPYYDSRYDRDRYNRYEYERERERREREYWERRRRDDHRHDHHDHDHDRRDRYNPPRRPLARPDVKPDIRPNCPSGTRYDGRHCVITDQKLRKPGGDGKINPCPKGMWVSNGKCMGK